MGLFSFGKKKQDNGFEFLINEVFALKTPKSVVAAGKMARGKVIPGTRAICLNEEGEPLFSCRIDGIEQGTRLMKMASANAGGTYGSQFGFKLSGVEKNQIPEGARLVTETVELLERISTSSVNQQGSNGENADASGGPLGRRKEEELEAMLTGSVLLTQSQLEPLTIQECIFLLCLLQKEGEGADPSYQEKGNLIYSEILRKLKEAPSLYLILDEGSGLPFILGDTIDLFSEKRLAQKAVQFYESQYRHLFVREIPKDRTGLPCRISLFTWLAYLGMEKILVDNGAYKLFVKRSDLLADPGEEYQPEVPVANPALRFAMADFLEEVRWKVTYPEREEMVAGKKERMIAELLKAKFLVPMKYGGTNLKEGENELNLKEEKAVLFPRIENQEEKQYLPVFTDWLEFQKAYKKEMWSCLVFSLRDVMMAAGKDPVVVNPLSENLILDQELLESLKKGVFKEKTDENVSN